MFIKHTFLDVFSVVGNLVEEFKDVNEQSRVDQWA